MNVSSRCEYKDPEGNQCECEAGDSGLCYWHDPQVAKDDPDLADKLEQYARSGGMLKGIYLIRANLQGINLVRHGCSEGFDMSGADLYRADLRGAHLFNLNLRGGSLMKADLRDANVHCAQLQYCNLLGARWEGAKIENIDVGKRVRQETEAIDAERRKEREEANDLYQQAEEIYRDLRKAAEFAGIFAMSGYFIQRELTVRRYRMPRLSTGRILSKIVDLFCGYGEAPSRVVIFSMILILICAMAYFFTGLDYSGEVQQFSWDNGFASNLATFGGCLYYSVVTFTTLGYGDFIPIGFSRVIAALEAFIGSFTMALFVVVFVKKMTR